MLAEYFDVDRRDEMLEMRRGDVSVPCTFGERQGLVMEDWLMLHISCIKRSWG